VKFNSISAAPSARGTHELGSVLRRSLFTPTPNPSGTAHTSTITAAFRDEQQWAFHPRTEGAQEDCNTLASTATTVKRPSLPVPEQAADALTGLLLTSPTKKARTGAEANNNTVAGYSPELLPIPQWLYGWDRMPNCDACD